MKTLHNTRNYVYILREGGKRSRNYFKIGKGCDAKRKNDAGRYKNIQGGNPRKLHLIEKIYHVNSDKLESFCHKNLMEFHHRGEWFYLNQELLLNKLKENIDAFEELNSIEIKKIKSPLKFFSNSEQAQLFAQTGKIKRRENAMEWAESVNLRYRIQEAIKKLNRPTQESICQMLNEQNILTIRGVKWNRVNLLQQLKRLGIPWKELKVG